MEEKENRSVGRKGKKKENKPKRNESIDKKEGNKGGRKRKGQETKTTLEGGEGIGK